MNYESAFREGLNAYMNDKLIKSASVADRAGIRRDTFSQIINGGCKIYADEAAAICKALEVPFDFLLTYRTKNECSNEWNIT